MRHKLIGSVFVCLGMVMAFSSCGSASSTSETVSSESDASSSVANSIPASSVIEEIASSEVIVEEQEPVEPREGDFRVGFWGDTKETIKEYETAEYYSDEDNLVTYLGEVSGEDSIIFYAFDEAGKLYQGMYIFLNSYNQGHLYIRDYNSLKDSLIAKYGEPAIDKVLEYSSLADYTDEGQALELGYTGYIAEWETDTTEITLVLTSENYDITMALEYEDINHEEVYDTEGL